MSIILISHTWVFPSVVFSILNALAQQGGLVHELFGDAAHVDAGSSQPPSRAQWGWLDKVANCNLKKFSLSTTNMRFSVMFQL